MQTPSVCAKIILNDKEGVKIEDSIFRRFHNRLRAGQGGRNIPRFGLRQNSCGQTSPHISRHGHRTYQQGRHGRRSVRSACARQARRHRPQARRSGHNDRHKQYAALL